MRDILQIWEHLLGAQPWWVYCLLALVPLCILITIRELTCWFLKTNKTLGRLDRLESRIVRLEKATKEALLKDSTSINDSHPEAKGYGPTALSTSSLKASSLSADTQKGPNKLTEDYTLK